MINQQTQKKLAPAPSKWHRPPRDGGDLQNQSRCQSKAKSWPRPASRPVPGLTSSPRKRGPHNASVISNEGKMKKPIAIVLVFLCLATLAWAGLRANAAWHFLAAQSIAEPLFEVGNGDVTAFESTEFHINIALRRFPGNPDYLDLSGRLKVLKVGQPGVVGAEHRQLLESAAEDFRQALSSRPLWPYSWANLLTTKDKLGQVDMEFNTALSRSAELGPWEPRVQLQVIDSGLRNWGKLGGAERAVVEQKVFDGLKVQPRGVFALVKDYGRADLLCVEEIKRTQIKRWCNKVIAQ